MNQKQRDYARTRIKEIRREKLKAIAANYQKLTKSLSVEDAKKLLREGKLKLSKKWLAKTWPTIYDNFNVVFDFESHGKKPTTTQTKRYEAKRSAVVQLCADVTDEIMLANDTTIALKRIKELERLSTTI